MKSTLTLVAVLLMLAAPASAQVAVNQADGPPPNADQAIYGYSGTDLVYICWAQSILTTGQRAATRVSISAGTNANPVSLTSTGHGFYFNAAGTTSPRPKVTVSGGTGNWAAVNGTWTATITGANTFTIPVDSTAFGAVAGTLVFTTTAPRTGMYEWAVKKFEYSAGTAVWSGWLNGTNALVNRCSDATSTTLNQQ